MVNNSKSIGISYKDVIERIKSLDPYNKEMFRKRDDLSLSRLFSELFEEQVRYNVTAKEWFSYDGRVWRRDDGAMNTEKLMKTFIQAMTVYSMTVDDPDYTRFIAKYGDRHNRKRLIEDARDYNYMDQEMLDANPNLFNCQNCVLDLQTGKTKEHDPSLLLSKISNVTYDPNVVSRDFQKFIHEVMMDDEEKIQYLQRVFGYSLTGENTQEQCYICYGSTTRNGKSTLLDVIGYMMGDYAMNIQPETLAQKDKNTKNASGDIARLKGCRLLHMSEPPKRMIFDVALLKTLLGRDPITARHIYEREFEFIPIFKLVINTNYLPVVTDDTLFKSERVKVITFERHFTPEEQDRHLKSKLKTDDNLSGILNWCICGLHAFHKAGDIIIDPDPIRRATEEYRQKSDKIQNYIDECLMPLSGKNTAVKQAYEVFAQWCQDNGYGIDNKSNFIEELKGKGVYAKTGSVNGKTTKNVIRGYVIAQGTLY